MGCMGFEMILIKNQNKVINGWCVCLKLNYIMDIFGIIDVIIYIVYKK